MASPDSAAAAASLPPSSTKKDEVTPISSKIAELNESRSELLTRIQSLKQDLQSWRSKLDTQVKVYRDASSFSFFGSVESYIAERLRVYAGSATLPCAYVHLFPFAGELSELKKTLNVEVEQLRTEFQDLRTTLQQQQEDVTASLKNLGLQDVAGDVKQTQSQEVKIEEIDKEEQQVLPEEHTAKVDKI
ncbi:hypothetical protein Ahy_A04g020783 [Arachis hypogaea]|uniref:Uncharacterized protein n=1 Tax=Arachis hypogaea TaxID=3818 RepID=A0A445DIH9_ARAHY|nr:hypothetical protein Ahy_A04g020783 [Arachis hypogaea]